MIFVQKFTQPPFWRQELYAKKTCVNCNDNHFVTKEHKCLKMGQFAPKVRKSHILCSSSTQICTISVGLNPHHIFCVKLLHKLLCEINTQILALCVSLDIAVYSPELPVHISLGARLLFQPGSRKIPSKQ